MRWERGPELAQFIVGAPQGPPPPPPGDAPVAFADGHPRNVVGGVDVHLAVGPIVPGAKVPSRAVAVFSPVVVPPGYDMAALVASDCPKGEVDVAYPGGESLAVPLHAPNIPEAGYHLVVALGYAD